MFNFIIINLILLILIFQKILLLNEETLILICFISFCWIAYNKIGDSIAFSFKDDSSKIKNILIDSLNQVAYNLNQYIIANLKFAKLQTNFNELKQHFIILISLTSVNFPKYSEQNIKLLYARKLFYTWRLEQQTIKLITALILKKIEKIAFTKQFCTQKLCLPYFKCLDKIILREYLEKV